ncbi:MAG: hypothetical protein Kow0069_17360 [Promethearchaeota archaeon]
MENALNGLREYFRPGLTIGQARRLHLEEYGRKHGENKLSPLLAVQVIYKGRVLFDDFVIPNDPDEYEDFIRELKLMATQADP